MRSGDPLKKGQELCGAQFFPKRRAELCIVAAPAKGEPPHPQRPSSHVDDG
jgi:hypothetical protein